MAKVMVVEDDNSLREIYTDSLQAEGYEVVSAANGEEALATAVKEKPDLIILDVMMPKISGFDVLDILRSTPETKGARIMMMTALSQQSDKERGKRLGADRYLVKSQVTIPDIIDNVGQLLNSDEQPTPATQSNTDTQAAPPMNVPNLPVANSPAQRQPQPPQAVGSTAPTVSGTDSQDVATQPQTTQQPPAVVPGSSEPTPISATSTVQPPPMSTGPASQPTTAKADIHNQPSQPDSAQLTQPRPTNQPVTPATPQPTAAAPQLEPDTTTIDEIVKQPSAKTPKPDSEQSQAVDSARNAVDKLAEPSEQENQEVQQQVTEFAAKPLSEQTIQTPAEGDEVEDSLNAEIDAISSELDDETSSNTTNKDKAGSSSTAPPATTTTSSPQPSASKQRDFEEMPKLEPSKRSRSSSRLSSQTSNSSKDDDSDAPRPDTASAPPKLATPKGDRLSVTPPPQSQPPSLEQSSGDGTTPQATKPQTAAPVTNRPSPPPIKTPPATDNLQPRPQPQQPTASTSEVAATESTQTVKKPAPSDSSSQPAPVQANPPQQPTTPAPAPQTPTTEQSAFNQPGDTIQPNGPNYGANNVQNQEQNPLIKPETNNSSNPHDIAL